MTGVAGLPRFSRFSGEPFRWRRTGAEVQGHDLPASPELGTGLAAEGDPSGASWLRRVATVDGAARVRIRSSEQFGGGATQGIPRW